VQAGKAIGHFSNCPYPSAAEEKLCEEAKKVRGRAWQRITKGLLLDLE
jgi:hypothetical protein